MPPLELRIPADPGALTELRQAVRSWLHSLGIVEEDVDSIVAACSEVAAGAIETGPVDVRGELAGGDVVVRCTGPAGWRIDDHSSRWVARLLVDDVLIEPSSDAVSVVLRKAASRGLR